MKFTDNKILVQQWPPTRLKRE